MFALDLPTDFDHWRVQARLLWQKGIPPANVRWGDAGLFAAKLEADGNSAGDMTVPKAFAALAANVAMHRDIGRFELLYRLLWRIQHNRSLLQDATDPDIALAFRMEKAVRRDMHKMRAFVRFREVADEQGRTRYVAWFEPDHHIVRANAGFFVRRFASMDWSILTPDLCIHWDKEKLLESPGIDQPDELKDDPAEELWRGYYRAIFNPARLKTRAMLKEMPRRYWKNMPETRLIPELIAGAQAREAAMIATGSVPDEAAPANWEQWQHGIDRCTRCPLYRDATQAVPGEGPRDARLMIVGEQPGDQEDLSGRPFVGPAGQILDEALATAGIDRSGVYLTNAVKHFKFQRQGKRRLHQTPTAGEIDHCRWWLDAERDLVRPQVILALGASALRGLIGKTASISAMRGKAIDVPGGATLFVTTHPSYILRVGPERRARAMEAFTDDLRSVARQLAQSGSPFRG